MKAKYAFATFAILILITIPVVSADLVGDITSGIAHLISVSPIINDASPVYNEKILLPNPGAKIARYEYKKITQSDDFFYSLQQTFGFVPKKESTTVTINGQFAASLPPGSKFENIIIHEACLPFQYGTDDWYNCEVIIQ